MQYIHVPENTRENLIALAQRAEMNSGNWGSPIYGIARKNFDLTRVQRGAPRQSVWHMVDSELASALIVASGTAMPTVETVVDLSAIVPDSATMVRLKLTIAGSGGAGCANIPFLDPLVDLSVALQDPRTADSVISHRNEWTQNMIRFVDVPLSPNGKFRWFGAYRGTGTLTVGIKLAAVLA